MPETICTTVYQFDELGDEAKEKARDWYRLLVGPEDMEFVTEDAKKIGAILGITIEKGPWWTLYVQGSGASFEGSYSYVKGAHKAIREYAPWDTTLHEIADELLAAQRRQFYGVNARISSQSRYHHLDIESSHDQGNSYYWTCPEVEGAIRNFADWIHQSIERGWEYETSAEVVDENIRCNEYTFTASGERFG